MAMTKFNFIALEDFKLEETFVLPQKSLESISSNSSSSKSRLIKVSGRKKQWQEKGKQGGN